MPGFQTTLFLMVVTAILTYIGTRMILEKKAVDLWKMKNREFTKWVTQTKAGEVLGRFETLQDAFKSMYEFNQRPLTRVGGDWKFYDAWSNSEGLKVTS